MDAPLADNEETNSHSQPAHFLPCKGSNSCTGLSSIWPTDPGKKESAWPKWKVLTVVR